MIVPKSNDNEAKVKKTPNKKTLRSTKQNIHCVMPLFWIN
jgi:hypothetical protein